MATKRSNKKTTKRDRTKQAPTTHEEQPTTSESEPTTVPGKESTYDKKRRELRDTLWPNAKYHVWSRHDNDGFVTIPRLLALVTHLIRSLTPKSDPSKAYWELWCRTRDQMFVTIDDEDAHAFAAGYTGTRGLRTWRENMWKLQKLGFIRILPEGNRDIGHVLIVNPLEVCAQLYKSRPNDVTEQWWSAFVRRASDIKAEIPKVSE